MTRRMFDPQRFTTDPHNLLGAEGRGKMRKLDSDEREQPATEYKGSLGSQIHSPAGEHRRKAERALPEQPVQTPEDIANAVRRKVSDAAHLGGYAINAPNELAILVNAACANGLTAEQLTISDAHNFIRRSETEHRVNQAIALVTPEDLAIDPELAVTIRGYVEAAPAITTLEDIVASAKEERAKIIAANARLQAEEFQNLVGEDTGALQSSAQHEGMRKAAVPKVMNELSRRESIINRRLAAAREKGNTINTERVHKANELLKELEAFIEKIKLLGIRQPKPHELEATRTTIQTLQELDTEGRNSKALEQFLQYCYTPDTSNRKILLATRFRKYYEPILEYTDGQVGLYNAFSELEDVRHGENYNYQPTKTHTGNRLPKGVSVASMRPGPETLQQRQQRNNEIQRRAQKQSSQAERDEESFAA